MLEIIGRRSAFNVQKALWAIGELGLPHRHIEAGGSAGGLDTPEFLLMNPHGRIPVVRDEGAVIWESHSVVRYLAAKYGAGTLWASDPAERSLADRWMDWAQSALQPDFMQLFWSFYRTPERERKAKRIEKASAACVQHFERLDRHLESHRFLAGDHFTMGDIPAGASLYRYFEMGVPTPPVPQVRRWYDALAERAAFREHIMLPFEELHGRLAF
jgi:glutathione S-transferase